MILEPTKPGFFISYDEPFDTSKSPESIEGNAADQVMSIQPAKEESIGSKPKLEPESLSEMPVFNSYGTGTISEPDPVENSSKITASRSGFSWQPVGIFIAVLAAIFLTLRS